MLYRKPAEAIVASIPAPTGGWNARDNIALMDEADAVMMQNWFPGTTSVSMRYGHSTHVTGVVGTVESLLVWNGPGASTMFGVSSNGSLYDVSAFGAVGAAQVTGLVSARWQYINVSTLGGNYLQAVNGTDKALIYDGSWHRDGDGAPYDITGVDSANCSQINLHKNRVWLVEDGTLSAWYLPTSAIGGSATAFRLNGVAQLGGYLMWMATWTIDAGYGMDDMAVFMTSEGEVIVYMGTDPASAATWQLVGVYHVGKPLGRRSFLKYSGDLLIVTQDGVQPMSAALQSSRTNPRVSLTDKIQNAMSTAAQIAGNNFGWEMTYYPAANQLYLNVPLLTNAPEQYVMNTITKQWCSFNGWNASCFTVYNDDLYFGGSGGVFLAWDGDSDDNGSNIEGTTLQAFNYLNTRSKQKQFTMTRPVFQTNSAPMVFGGINVDFDTSDITATLLSVSPGGAALWDTAVWDGAYWAPEVSPVLVWQGAQGIGYCGAPRVKAQMGAGERLQWAATDVVFRSGAIL